MGSKRGIESNICSLYGGRIAEELTLGKEGVTTGASNDIERATKYARNYVTKWGLSDKLGAQLYSEDEQNGYLGSSGGGQLSHLSDDTARLIDSEKSTQQKNQTPKRKEKRRINAKRPHTSPHN